MPHAELHGPRTESLCPSIAGVVTCALKIESVQYEREPLMAIRDDQGSQAQDDIVFFWWKRGTD